jgi:Lrp/AsnC family transcriptional regulator for asnA, asnC and gidA
LKFEVKKQGIEGVYMNELDANILRNLLKDGRISYVELAKKCGVSKNKVWKRCSAMEKKGIITGATTQMNFEDFGYAALATLLISVEAQQIEEVMEFIEKITEIRAHRQYNSVYNVRAFATLKNLNELDYIKQIIRRKLPTIGLKTYIWMGVRNIPENLNLNGHMDGINESSDINSKAPIYKSTNKKIIDETDRQILQELTVNGRMAFTKLAKVCGLSTNTVLNRYKHLVENGAIKVSIQIDPKKIGYSSILDFNIAFTTLRGLSDDIVESFSKIPDIIIITKTSGDYDLQVTAMIRDLEQSFAIQDQIARVHGVTQIETSSRKIPDRWPTPQQYISTI